MGGEPLYISLSFVLPEGFSIDDLEKILKSIKLELEKINAKVATADTKVMPKDALDGIIITASSIGKIYYKGISSHNLKPNDKIIVSGSIGDHGATIFSLREGINLDLEIESDCESLWPKLKQIYDLNLEIHAVRDPTRGGIAAVLNEWAKNSKVDILVKEESIPVKDPVRGFCELLGFEPYYLACEGRFLIVAPEESANLILKELKKFDEQASLIGEVIYPSEKPTVLLENEYGIKRVLETSGLELLPRIC